MIYLSASVNNGLYNMAININFNISTKIEYRITKEFVTMLYRWGIINSKQRGAACVMALSKWSNIKKPGKY